MESNGGIKRGKIPLILLFGRAGGYAEFPEASRCPDDDSLFKRRAIERCDIVIKVVIVIVRVAANLTFISVITVPSKAALNFSVLVFFKKTQRGEREGRRVYSRL